MFRVLVERDCRAELRPPRVHQRSKGTPDPYKGWTSPFSGLESLSLCGFSIIWGELSPPAWNNLPPAQALAWLSGLHILLVLPRLVPHLDMQCPQRWIFGGQAPPN